MKKLFLPLAAVLCALLAASPAHSAAAPAANPELVPDIVTTGFAAYSRSGYSLALDTWCKGSSLEVDGNAKVTIGKNLSDEENFAGSFAGAETIKVVGLSPSSTLVYTFAKYQKGGLYLCFACVKSAGKWLVTSIVSNSDPAKVLPTNILSGQ